MDSYDPVTLQPGAAAYAQWPLPAAQKMWGLVSPWAPGPRVAFSSCPGRGRGRCGRGPATACAGARGPARSLGWRSAQGWVGCGGRGGGVGEPAVLSLSESGFKTVPHSSHTGKLVQMLSEPSWIFFFNS